MAGRPFDASVLALLGRYRYHFLEKMLIVTTEALGNLIRTLASISWRALEGVKMSFAESY